MASLILNLGARWGRVVNFTFRPSYLGGKNPPFSFNKRMGGPQSRSGHLEKLCCLFNARTGIAFPPVSMLQPNYYTDRALPAPQLTRISKKEIRETASIINYQY